jgi:hypothetical protein
MGIQIVGAVFDDLLGAGALGGGGDVEDAGFYATGSEAAPVRLGQAEYESFFGRIVRLEGFAKAAENFVVLVPVLVGEDYECGGGEAVLEGVQAAALFAGFGVGSAFAAVAAIGFELSL